MRNSYILYKIPRQQCRVCAKLAVVSNDPLAYMSVAKCDVCRSGHMAYVCNSVQVVSGRVVLSPGATLTWLGFTEEDLLSTYDSEVPCS